MTIHQIIRNSHVHRRDTVASKVHRLDAIAARVGDRIWVNRYIWPATLINGYKDTNPRRIHDPIAGNLAPDDSGVVRVEADNPVPSGAIEVIVRDGYIRCSRFLSADKDPASAPGKCNIDRIVGESERLGSVGTSSFGSNLSW